MAGNKENPRQKMIGMMYLVLTALLALNVQREILYAFVTLNNGIEQSNEDSFSRSGALYNDLKFAHNLDPEKVTPYWSSAELLKSQTNELIQWIDSLQVDIIAVTEGISRAMAYTISLDYIKGLDKYDEPTRILIGTKGDASTGKALELKNKILDFHQMTSHTLNNHNLAPIKLGIDFSDNTISDKLLNWEMKTFYDTPLAAVIAILNKLKGDIVNLEYEVLNQLMGEIDSGDIPVDTIVARIIPSKKYVVIGEDYHSEIFLGAYSTTLSPKMEIIANNSTKEKLEVVDGIGTYSFHPTHSGVHKYNGEITITDKKGKEKKYPFKSEFIAVQPSAVVSATAMNVFYKGLENPLAISVPGIEDENIAASISGAGNKLVKVSSGKYKVILANNSPMDVTINVSAKLTDGKSQNMGNILFRAKYLPTPYAKLGKIKNSGKMKAKDLGNIRGLIAKYGSDFVFNLPISVSKFKVVMIKNGETPRCF